MTQNKSLFPEEEAVMDESIQSNQADFDKQTVSSTFWGAGLLTLAGLLFVIIGFLIAEIDNWQTIVLLAAPAALFVVGLVAIFFLRRGKIVLGTNLIFLANLIMPLTVISLQYNIGWAAILYTLVSSTLIIWSTLPRQSRKWSSIIASISLTAMAVIELIDSPIRVTPAEELVTVIVVVTVLLAASFIVQAIRLTWGRSMRNNLLVAFIGVTVVASSALGTYMYITISNLLTDRIGQQLKSVAEGRGLIIGDYINGQVGALQTLALDETIRQSVRQANALKPTLDSILNLDTQWRQAVADNDDNSLTNSRMSNSLSNDLRAFQALAPEHVEVFVTDRAGAIVSTTNRTSDYYQADEEWWSSTFQDGDGNVYISQPEYDESIDSLSLLLAVPIYDTRQGGLIGILRTTISLDSLGSVLGEPIGETGEIDILFPDETMLDTREGEYEEINPESMTAIQDSARQIYQIAFFEGEDSILSQAPVRAQAAIAKVNELGWTVIVSQDSSEAFAPVNAATRGAGIVIFIVIAIAAAAAFFIAQVLTRPIAQLTFTAEDVSAGNLNSRADVRSTDEVGTLATAFNSMTSRLQDTLQGLEQRVAERTRNLELAAEVGRSVSKVRDLEVMLRDACDLILKEFDLYYVQVYLTDPSQTNLVLEAGTGEVGAQLRARGHSLQLNTGSINGRAAIEMRAVVISDTTQSATFQPNPLLPDTRGEMAVPLIVGGNVVGVLDMQTTVPGVLNEEVLTAFEALAGQLAVAVQNANLVAETEEAHAEVEAQARRLMRQGWAEHLDAIHKPEQFGFMFNRIEVTPLYETEEAELAEDGEAVSAPISLTGEMLGSLVVEIDEERQNEQTGELVKTVARQVAQQLENLRLLESSERYRFEAEQAARRQTREGWLEYIQSRTEDSLGYLYDQNKVHPHSNGKDDPDALTLPLKARDEKIGKLTIQGIEPDDKESFDLASAVAERLGDHIESLRLFEETKQGQVELDNRARQLAAVAEVSTASSQELDIEKLLVTVTNLTKERFNLYHAHVYLLNETADTLVLAAGAGDVGRQMVDEGWQIAVDHEASLVARAARTQQSMISNDIVRDSDSEFLSNRLLPDTRSELAVPLIVGDKLLGVFDVQSDRGNAFTEEDANIQMTLASQIATAMQNARSFAQAQKQAERETMLNTINQKIQSATSVEAVLQIAARELGHALGAPMTIAQLSMKDNEN